MLILGIDQSYTSTGICMIDQNKHILHHELIKSDKTQDIFLRSKFIIDRISYIINMNSPNAIGIEGLSFSNFGNATRDLAGLQFVLVHMLRFDFDYNNSMLAIIPPTKLKMYGSGKGNSKKDDMVASLPENVLQLFKDSNYKKTSGLYDATDAYFIACYTLEQFLKNPIINKRTVLP